MGCVGSRVTTMEGGTLHSGPRDAVLMGSVFSLAFVQLLLHAGAPVSVLDVLVKNLIPVTIGNAIAGALVVAVSMSFSFGRLGRQRN